MPGLYHLNVKIDRELERALRAHAEASGLELSAATRDLLRHALGVVSNGRDAGWLEGYNAGLAAVKKTVGEALRDLANK
ncbi:MAG: hypothetical protein GTO41_15930 [Burkholderiales bacterium]|nr:hypothetical protein [Burkholderiales bacterium]